MMSRPSRRELLGGACGLLAVIAGCLGDPSGNPSDDGEADDDGSATDGSLELTEHHVRAYQRAEPSSRPDAALLLDADDADAWLDERDFDADDSNTAFVTDTSFDASVLVALEADAPTPCHGLVVETVDTDDGALVLHAAIEDGSAEDEECPQQEVTVGKLVRATFDGDPPTELSAHIVGRDGTEHGIGIGAAVDEAPADD